MNDRQSECDTNDNWRDRVNWATDEDWVRAVANLEAETGVDILIGADLGNNLDVSGQIVRSQIDVDRLKVVLQDGLTELLSPEELMTLVTETNAYISDALAEILRNRVNRVTLDRSKI
jgi:serine/threonine protein phosphatase PrpC